MKYNIYERRSVMNNRKLAAFILGTVSAVSASAGIAAFAKANDAAMKNSSLENDFIRLTVEQDKSQMEYLRFCLDTNNGQTSTKDDDQKNLTYKNFYSGYTTLNINGENYVYGTGADTSEPKYDASKGTHTSSQKFGDVEVMQTLTFSEGFTKGYNDMLKISYKVLNADDGDKIGVRILLDPMIEDDDDLKLYVNDIKVDNETEFHAPIPDVWKADITADKNITAYGKNSGTEFKPDSITFANWDSLYNEEWNTPFDGSKNIEIRSSRLLSKDSFWNTENVTVYDSYICGEYLGWNSKNLTFVNCVIESLQGLCYIEGLTMKDCTLINTSLAFENSTVDIDVKGRIDSIFNPISGNITADEVGIVILDEDRVDPSAVSIVCRSGKQPKTLSSADVELSSGQEHQTELRLKG